MRRGFYILLTYIPDADPCGNTTSRTPTPSSTWWTVRTAPGWRSPGRSWRMYLGKYQEILWNIRRKGNISSQIAMVGHPETVFKVSFYDDGVRHFQDCSSIIWRHSLRSLVTAGDWRFINTPPTTPAGMTGCVTQRCSSSATRWTCPAASPPLRLRTSSAYTHTSPGSGTSRLVFCLRVHIYGIFTPTWISHFFPSR